MNDEPLSTSDKDITLVKRRQLSLFLAAWPSFHSPGATGTGFIPLPSFQNQSIVSAPPWGFVSQSQQAHILLLYPTWLSPFPHPRHSLPYPRKWTKRKGRESALENNLGWHPGIFGHHVRGMGTSRVWRYLTRIQWRIQSKYISRIWTAKRWNKNRSL